MSVDRCDLWADWHLNLEEEEGAAGNCAGRLRDVRSEKSNQNTRPQACRLISLPTESSPLSLSGYRSCPSLHENQCLPRTGKIYWAVNVARTNLQGDGRIHWIFRFLTRMVLATRRCKGTVPISMIRKCGILYIQKIS